MPQQINIFICSTAIQNSSASVSLNQGKMVTYNLKQNAAKTQSSSLKGKLMKTELGHGAEGFLIVK